MDYILANVVANSETDLKTSQLAWNMFFWTSQPLTEL